MGKPAGTCLNLILVDGGTEFKADLQAFLGQHDYGLVLESCYPSLETWSSARPQRAHALLFSDDLPGLAPSTVEAAFGQGAERVVILVTDPSARRLRDLRQAGAALSFKYSTGISLVETITAIAPRLSGQPASPLVAPGAVLGVPAGRAAGGRVIVTYSPVGGSGKTLIATHLAAGYAREQRRTVLVDLSQFGSTTPLLRVNSQGKGVSNLASILGADRDMAASPRFGEYLQQSLVRVAVPGGTLDLLPPPIPSRADQVTAEHVEAIIRTLRASQYDRIVIDTASEMTDRTAAAVTAATLTLMPMPPDFQAAYRCLLLRDMLGSLGVPRTGVAVVVNRWRTDTAFSIEEFRELLRLPVIGILPDAGGAAQRAANRGKLLTGRWGLAGALARLQGAVEQGRAMAGGRG